MPEKGSLLPRLAIRRPVTVIMTLLATFVVGLIAFKEIPVALFPSGFEAPYLGAWVPFRDSTPRETEEQIAKPIEEITKTINGVTSVETNSFERGMWLFLRFDRDTDMDVAYAQLRDRMDRVRPDLPDEVDRIYLRKFGEDDPDILWMAIVIEEEVSDPYYLVEQFVQRPLQKIDGVASVEIDGAFEKEILIYFSQDKVKRHQINLFQVINQLRNDNFVMSAGFVEEGERKVFLRADAQFENLEEIRNLRIKGTNIRLKDVAEVIYDVPKRDRVSRINRKPGIYLGIKRESTANTVALSEEIMTTLDSEIRNHPQLANFDFQVLFNQGEYIQSSVDNLRNAALWGGVFAFFVLFFFLRRVRMTLVVTLAIPISVMISLTLVYFIGWTLNLITMMGIMISTGMVVDNAIVILENIYRKRGQGLAPKKAALFGATEVGKAITFATLTTIVVFLPMIFISDDVGFSFYMVRIGMPVIFALLASLFVALVVIPLATTRIYSAKEVKEPRFIQWSNEIYRKFLVVVLRHRFAAFVGFLLLIFSSAFAIQNSVFTEGMNGNINDFRLRFQLPGHFTLAETEAFFKTIEDSVYAKSDVYRVKAVRTSCRKSFGQINVFLRPPEYVSWYGTIYKWTRAQIGMPVDAGLEREAVIADLKERIPKRPGIRMFTSWREMRRGFGTKVMLIGDDTERLAELGLEVERRLRLIPGVLGVEPDREEGTDEIRLKIDRDKAALYGISPREVAFTVSYALRGMDMPDFKTPDREIDIRVQMREEDRENLIQLLDMTMYADNGTPVPLSSIASFSVEKGFGNIRRENGKTNLGITLVTEEEDIGKLREDIRKALAGFELPYGYYWNMGGSFRDFEEQQDTQLLAMILAVVSLYLLIGILFESFVLPLVIILPSIAFAIFGSFWTLFLTGTEASLMAFIGIVILFGVVVNNGIVLIDMVQQRRSEGLSRYDALLDAGKHRFRPILMTAFTTMFGLIPMAIGGSNLMGIPYAPLGRVVMGGLFTSTFFTLLATPLLYTYLDDFRIWLAAFVRDVMQRTTILRNRMAASDSFADNPES
jgi:HAE1 family hydrophobic/amphiphilic exporter-1